MRRAVFRAKANFTEASACVREKRCWPIDHAHIQEGSVDRGVRARWHRAATLPKDHLVSARKDIRSCLSF
jgi:hypothetical protein